MTEKQKEDMERLNALVTRLNDEGRQRLLDVGNGYVMCLRDNNIPAVPAQAQQVAR